MRVMAGSLTEIGPFLEASAYLGKLLLRMNPLADPVADTLRFKLIMLSSHFPGDPRTCRIHVSSEGESQCAHAAVARTSPTNDSLISRQLCSSVNLGRIQSKMRKRNCMAVFSILTRATDAKGERKCCRAAFRVSVSRIQPTNSSVSVTVRSCRW